MESHYVKDAIIKNIVKTIKIFISLRTGETPILSPFSN